VKSNFLYRCRHHHTINCNQRRITCVNGRRHTLGITTGGGGADAVVVAVIVIGADVVDDDNECVKV
jgi:hypothetical protein